MMLVVRYSSNFIEVKETEYLILSMKISEVQMCVTMFVTNLQIVSFNTIKSIKKSIDLIESIEVTNGLLSLKRTKRKKKKFIDTTRPIQYHVLVIFSLHLYVGSFKL